MDGSLGTNLLALTTHFTLLCVDVGQVVLKRDGFELLASLDAFATTDTRGLAGFVSDSTFVFVVAKNDDATPLRTFESNLDNSPRASLRTGSTSCTLLLVNLRQTCLRIHVESIELAFVHTVATAETTIAAAC